jgi:hypothetical protein
MKLGLLGAPLLPVPCIGRCPDGAGPSHGFNYPTSGGGDTWIPLTCTIGARNILAPQCGQSGVISDAPSDGDSPLRLLGSNPAYGGIVPCAITLREEGPARLDVLTAAGTRVETLAEGAMSEGVHAVVWHAEDHPAGVYFLRLVAGGASVTKAVVLAR